MGHRHVSTFDDLVPSTYPSPPPPNSSPKKDGGRAGGEEEGKGEEGEIFHGRKKRPSFPSTRNQLVRASFFPRGASNPRLRRRKTARHLLTGARQSYFFLMQNLAACSRGIKSPPKAGSAEELRTPNKISLRRPVRIPEGLHIMYSPGCARVEI